MSFKKAKRSVDDLLYSLSSSLDQFRGNDGLHRFMTAGRLSLLSFIGEFDKTRDEMFDQRSECVLSTRHYLLKLTEQFASTVRAAEKLTVRVQEICETLETFHQHCDLELEFEDEAFPGVNMAFEESFREMKLLNQKIKGSFSDFAAAEATCKSLNDGAVAQLQEVDGDVSKSVSAKQTEFDAARRRVQVKRTALERASTMYGDRDAPELMLAEMNLQSAVGEMELCGSEYVECVRDAMRSTTFALEQTSMSTWSSTNVFFLQLSQFLEEVSCATRPLAMSFNDIKNAQKVSRRITLEKRTEAANSAAQAAAGGVRDPPSFARAQPREPADGVVEHSAPPSPMRYGQSSAAAAHTDLDLFVPGNRPAASAQPLRRPATDAFSNGEDLWAAPLPPPHAEQSQVVAGGPPTATSPQRRQPSTAAPTPPSADVQHGAAAPPPPPVTDRFSIDDLFD